MFKTKFSGHNRIWGPRKFWEHCPRMPPVATGLQKTPTYCSDQQILYTDWPLSKRSIHVPIASRPNTAPHSAALFNIKISCKVEPSAVFKFGQRNFIKYFRAVSQWSFWHDSLRGAERICSPKSFLSHSFPNDRDQVLLKKFEHFQRVWHPVHNRTEGGQQNVKAVVGVWRTARQLRKQPRHK